MLTAKGYSFVIAFAPSIFNTHLSGLLLPVLAAWSISIKAIRSKIGQMFTEKEILAAFTTPESVVPHFLEF